MISCYRALSPLATPAPVLPAPAHHNPAWAALRAAPDRPDHHVVAHRHIALGLALRLPLRVVLRLPLRVVLRPHQNARFARLE